MLFDWDQNKNEKNIRDHKVDFIDAALIWDDPLRQERVDGRENYDEARYQTIGRVSFGVLLVVYTDRYTEDGEEVARIISARKATKQERREYESRTFSMRIVR
ncbi:MAG: BrnT family toxin [Gammaproteobacteria bacterium]|nr:BrnT family toxin [Gammaproteobacteria bacterium]